MIYLFRGRPLTALLRRVARLRAGMAHAPMSGRRAAGLDVHDPEQLRGLASLRGPYARPVSEQALQDVRRALDKMPRRCREVFLMSQVDRLTFAEIGHRLGLNRRQVLKAMEGAIRAIDLALRLDR